MRRSHDLSRSSKSAPHFLPQVEPIPKYFITLRDLCSVDIEMGYVIPTHIMMTMNIEEVDERDSTWEQHDSIFRVYFAKGSDRAITTVDVSDATFSEVLKWAKETASDDTLVAIALVGLDARGLKGLTWLLGMDPNDQPESAIEFRMLAELSVESST